MGKARKNYFIYLMMLLIFGGLIYATILGGRQFLHSSPVQTVTDGNSAFSMFMSIVKDNLVHPFSTLLIQFIKEHYGVLAFDCKQYDRLYEFMKHDKKNSAGIINFTLLSEIGDIQINQSATKDEIFDMLDFYRESMGC